jgi:large subunit ribosomal protein L25
VAEVSLQAEVREGRGKGAARRLRAAGKVPAVMYGPGAQPLALAVEARALSHALGTDAGVNALIDLQVAGHDQHLAMARQLVRHPLRGSIVHVDFLLVDRDKPITVDIPIHIEGESPGVKEGGVLEHHIWSLHVECRPGDVPERIHVDVTSIQIGDSVHVSDLNIPPGVAVLTAAEEIVFSCVVPQAPKLEEEVAPLEGEEAEAAAAAAAAEGEGKAEETPAESE